MTDPLTPQDPKPNSDQAVCENCECIVDKFDLFRINQGHIKETIKGESGCINCISRCEWCGNDYLNEDMYDNPYLGYVCWTCEPGEEYQKASEDEITKDALRCLFDQTNNRRIEDLVIELAEKKGYNELAKEMKSDK